MAVKPYRKRATYADLERVAENLVGEILDGELFTSPRPRAPHAVAEVAIATDLHGNFNGPPGSARGPGGWWILMEPELHFDEDVLVPDVAGWRHERLPTIGDVAAFTLAPDWVCEVISPSTARIDRGRKLAIYARVGVAHLWFVDPLARMLERYRLQEGQWVLVAVHEGDASVRVEPFEAVELQSARWWLPEQPAASVG